jgi:hypothetical protein
VGHSCVHLQGWRAAVVRSLGVYFVPRLVTNILSIGQFDESWYKVDIYSGVMKIHGPGEQL